jgi:hypothetical protein
MPVSTARKLIDLRSVGPAAVADLALLNITTVAQLAAREPEELYAELIAATGVRQDPCVEDVFAAAVAQARDPDLPKEMCDWWYWSRQRKAAPPKTRRAARG